MRIRQLSAWLSVVLLLLAASLPRPLAAEEAAPAPTFKKEELQQLLAPIALYPDQLLAQVLMASTYPLQIVQAARWQKENSKLTGEALDKALNAKEWDPSVKSLVPFPQVLHMMSDKLEWTQKLGDAFLAQQADVMAEVQYLRAKAQEAGSLKSNKQQTVTKTESVIVIQPASPQVVYVPVYNPTIVYGTWWYPTYPPYYYPPPYGAAFVSGFFWGAAISASAHYWGWGNCNWHGGDINIDVNRYNQINVNKAQINSGTWQHNPANRGQVPYRDAKSREQYGQKARPAQSSREARGFEQGGAGARDQRGSGAKDVSKAGTGDRSAAGSRETPKASGADRSKGTSKSASRAAKPTKASSPSAFDVQRGSDVRAQASRGQASRKSMASHGGGRQSLGGGGRVGGGGRRR